MFNHIPLDQILFLDIETVSGEASYADLPDAMRDLWSHKARLISREDLADWTEKKAEETYNQRAGIYAEFGKIIVVSVAFLKMIDGQWQLRIKSFADEDETYLLRNFSELLASYFNNPDRQFLCGHNIREFDIPYLCRRMVIKGLKLPGIINLTGKKPWETKHLLDTMELWKFGDFKHFTSLKLLAAIMGIPSPKDDIDGSDVSRVYWEEADVDRIITYCEKDTATVAQLFLKFAGQPLLQNEQMISVP